MVKPKPKAIGFLGALFVKMKLLDQFLWCKYLLKVTNIWRFRINRGPLLIDNNKDQTSLNLQQISLFRYQDVQKKSMVCFNHVA